MNRTRPKNQRGGVFGMALLLCGAATVLGAGLDVASAPGMRFWFDAQPGAFALVGAGAACVAVIAAHIARLLLGRRASDETRGAAGADA